MWSASHCIEISAQSRRKLNLWQLSSSFKSFLVFREWNAVPSFITTFPSESDAIFSHCFPRKIVYDSANMEKYVTHISSSFRSWERNGGIPLAKFAFLQATKGSLLCHMEKSRPS